MKEKDFNLIPVAGTRNKVFVLRSKAVEKISKGGLILTTEANAPEPLDGVIIAISEADGNGVKPNLKVGDHVLFNEHGFKESEFEDTKFLVMTEADIFAKIKK